MKLSEEQINKFNKDGFLLIRNFAPTYLCDEILEEAKKHLDKKSSPIESEQEYLKINEQTTTVRRLRQVYNRAEIFRRWMKYEKIRPILKQLLNDTPVLTLAHHNSIMTKMPKDSSRTTWHQDRRYWNFENDDLISVWLSLDDEYLQNGLLEFIPGSHKLNLKKEQFDESISFRDDLKINKQLINKAVHYDLHKGDIVLFHCKTLHHAHKNNTQKPKISFVYTVKAQKNKAIKNTRSDFKEVILD
ncbi:phytanoyl-CoA dioxygenase [Malaciobacter halophilus]|uniref:Phytanoyl-CoA dioxygenase n=1 Tax=Malaciobacter halophilus TaxID=197482 RepID=A0A2N1J2Y3_9BACT|nr:phytanoyl-CoA dioxygenase family protein [Malaciobacter halophilus]AXH10637.1 PhyH family dioxygenase [Malaciobacter halophilus]PKI80920.1 phytanoyl-CoA dioxygenase [Malaciobacter halophilus]